MACHNSPEDTIGIGFRRVQSTSTEDKILLRFDIR